MKVDLQPLLRGNLIELRPLRPEDFEALFQAASDPLIWEQHPEPNRYQLETFQKYFSGAIESKGAFAIIDLATGHIIGSSRYSDYKPAGREIEIGWTFLRREFWGGHYNRELKALMLNHAFQFVDRVVFRVGADNLRSQMALQKLGAKLLAGNDIPAGEGSLIPDLVFVIAPT